MNATPAPDWTEPTTAFEHLAVNTAATVARVTLAERASLLSRVAAIEAEHGYGTPEKPTTKQLRDKWRKHRGVCPECGKRVL